MAETVLVVDDEDIVREVLSDMLREAGFEVVEARHGGEAMARLAATRVDLVLSDISMPVVDGYGLYEHVRKHPSFGALPFIFLTAHGERPRLRHAKELGVDDYLVKPVGSEDLVVAVRALLARHARLAAAHDAQIGQLKQAILLAVAHELRTPLTYLTGYTELLAGMPEAARLRTLVDGIMRGARRLQRLAQDLVFLVELRSGEAYAGFDRDKTEIAALPELLREVVDQRRATLESPNLTLVCALPDALPPVIGNPRLLREAVDRLLDNAIKFSPPQGGSVTLRASAADAALTIDVEDQGVGIPAAELARVCELFHQVERKRHEQQGVGVGLSIASTVALLHGGCLQARSTPGEGSTFSIRLPLAPAAA